MDQPEFVVVGPGRLGLHLLKRLLQAGWQCTAVRTRHGGSPKGRGGAEIWDSWDTPAEWSIPTVIFVTVGDDVLAGVDSQIAASLNLEGAVILHTSGLLLSSRLRKCRDAGAFVGSWHPLQSFPPEASQRVEWQGVPCAIEGDQPAVELGYRAARAVGAFPWTIEPTDKPVYHAAAVVAANLSHILIAEGSRLISQCGCPELEGGGNPLAQVVKTSSTAALEAPDLSRLTGPISRGDANAIEQHLRVLPAPLVQAYRSLAQLAKTQLSKG